ncbi:MAG: hypothetical protein QOF89_4731 [Acidobacteriota bacterium]|jgi:hypothetical protein|nr:hypothetical protein [Acidobacteriota bacterium]
MRSRGLIVCILLLLAAVPALAVRPIDRIPAGVDYWQTLSSGATAYSFANNPIPAGFFCGKSAPFRGRVFFEGVPLHSEPAGILGTTDTIIERLDNAAFDKNGDARTRIRGRALNLQGSAPIKTACGSFKVTANLTDDQPESTMVFHREHPFGGTFKAQLKLRVSINFTSLATGKTFSVARNVDLPTVNAVPFAMGSMAVQCASTTTIAAEQVTLADGRPLITRAPGTPGKLAAAGEQPVERDPGTVEPAPSPTPVATGCYCNPNPPYNCMNTYAWHDPCANNPNCELHFTHTPCELGYRSQCTATDTGATGSQSYLGQLQVLYDRGYLTDKPEVALQKQLRTAKQIEKDQAARDREMRQQQ